MIITDEQLQSLVGNSSIVDPDELGKIASFAKNAKLSLYDALVENNKATDEQLGLLVANNLGYPFIILTKIAISEDVLKIIPEKLARKYKAIAFERDNDTVKVAMSDPANKKLQEMIAKKTKAVVVPYFATERDFFNTLHIYKKTLQKTFDYLLREAISENADSQLNDAPIGKIVDLLIDSAYQDKASDIHIEPEEKNTLVRYRIDGILHDELFIPKILHERMITRIKVLSQLRTDEHLAPQDGKMRADLDEETIDLRVSIIPIVNGEKVVLRLLSSKFRQFSLTDLGMNESDLTKITKAINKSYGMILSTGPTGSGKTTTIYAILKILNTREKNITTIEDPVEYRIKGVNQIQTNVKTNLTFASGLRSILRQDPNIVFVGEIRDSETAAIAVNSALTGHLVLSTLHTNDAAASIPRLIDMKIEPFLVSSTVNVIIGQRLVRKICEMCKAEKQINREDLRIQIPEEIVKKHFGTENIITFFYGKGCKICHSSGYKGRIGVYEVLVLSKNIRKLLVEKNDADVMLRAALDEGMTTMLDDGLDKAKKGFTTFDEVLRVTKIENS